MLLVVDIGNTTTRVGVWDGGEVGVVSVSPTHELAASARVGEVARQASGQGAAGGEVALCCVVPSAESAWREWAAGEGREVFVVRGDTETPLRNRYRDPERLGGDRLAAAVGAVRRFGAPVLVASLGTAPMVDAVSAEREFLGGAIGVGVQTGLDALAKSTEALPRVAANEVAGAIGADTEECLGVAAVHGTAGLVAGLAERMREVVGANAPLAITGGHAELISGYLRVAHEVAPTLLLEGVGAVWEHHRGERG